MALTGGRQGLEETDNKENFERTLYELLWLTGQQLP